MPQRSKAHSFGRAQLSQGDWGRSPQQAMEGQRPEARRAPSGGDISPLPCKEKSKTTKTKQQIKQRKEKMQKQIKTTATKTAKLILLLSTTLSVACTSMHKRDERLVQNIEMQNAVIESTKADRATSVVQEEIQKSETLKESEERLVKALDALLAANNTVLGKMKPTNKQECNNGQNEGDDNEQ